MNPVVSLGDIKYTRLMKNKTCFKCKKEKSLEEFYKHKQMADGHLNKCKDCTKRDSSRHRNENLERYREYDRKRGNRLPDGYLKEYRKRYPKKEKAKSMLNNAIRDGKIKKENECQDCGSTRSIHGHHDDYDYPLSVRWLCAACHHQWHAKNGEGKNAQ